MENASKALIMAGSILIALIVIGALVLMFGSLTDYQQSNNAQITDEEVVEFNNGYATYIKNNVRGNDLISLMNKIADYNKRKSEEGYEKMQIRVTGIDVSQSSPLKYNTSTASPKLIKAEYTQDNLDVLIAPMKKLETAYQQKYISALASNISNIVGTSSNADAEKEVRKILKLGDSADFPEGRTIAQVQEDVEKYYEYQQFKRSYFDIDGEPKYNQNTGRIISMNFKYNRTGE